jgi:hypothetical protein
MIRLVPQNRYKDLSLNSLDPLIIDHNCQTHEKCCNYEEKDYSKLSQTCSKIADQDI